MSTRKHWRGPPRRTRAPGSDAGTPTQHDTICKVSEYVEQRQRLLNVNSVPRAFRHRKWTASSRRTAIFTWRSKTPTKSTHDLLRLTSQCSSIRGSQKPRLPKRSQILALIRTNVAQRTEGQEYRGERGQPGGRSTHWIPSNRTRR